MSELLKEKNMIQYISPLMGGILIGLASWLVLVSLGRVTGISGIANSAFFESALSADNRWRWFFMAGLIVGGALFATWFSTPISAPRSPWLMVGSGLLVGFGTVYGSGCTSGHGVCGLGRRSIRSLVATCIFMVVAALTVWMTK